MKKYFVSMLLLMASLVMSQTDSQAQSQGSNYNIVIVDAPSAVQEAHQNWIDSEEGQAILGTGYYVFTGDYIKILNPATGTVPTTYAPAQWYYALYAPPEGGPSPLAALLISVDGETVIFLGYNAFIFTTTDLENARNDNN